MAIQRGVAGRTQLEEGVGLRRVDAAQRRGQQRAHQGIIADHGGLVGGVTQQSDDVLTVPSARRPRR